MATKLIEELKPLADGVTKVPMKLRFGDFTNDVISKVLNLVVQDTKDTYCHSGHHHLKSDSKECRGEEREKERERVGESPHRKQTLSTEAIL